MGILVYNIIYLYLLGHLFMAMIQSATSNFASFFLVFVLLYLLCQHLSMSILIHSLIYTKCTPVLIYARNNNTYRFTHLQHSQMSYIRIYINIINTFMTNFVVYRGYSIVTHEYVMMVRHLEHANEPQNKGVFQLKWYSVNPRYNIFQSNPCLI